MKHCQSTIFHGDIYCADCGEVLTDIPEKHSVEDIYPNIFDDVRKYYKDVEAKTGRVLESRLYKRFSKTSSQNLEYSYWWVKLETNQGEIIETSISAEHKYTASVGRGDILTLYYPTTMSLLYKQSRESKSFVKNNQSAPCVVVHDNEGQRYTVENLYPAPSKKSPWLWIVAGILTALPLFSAPGSSANSAWIVTVAVALVALFLEIKRNKKKFEIATAKHEALNASFKKLLDVTKYQLGYNNIERHKQPSDVICIQCNARLPENTAYCVCCGNQSAVKPSPALTSHQLSGSDFGYIGSVDPMLEPNNSDPNITQHAVTQTSSEPTSISVSDIQQRLDEIYSYYSQNTYTHYYVLHSARQGKVSNEFILARVKSLSLNADVSDITRRTTTTTETKHYRGGNYQYSTYDTEHSSYRNRSSTLKGKVLLEYVSGQTVTFTLSEDILGDVDVGDWLAIADSYLEFEDQNYYCFEYAYNITKDKEYSDKSFVNYSDVRGSNAWWGWNLLFFIGFIAGAFSDSDALISMSAIGFTLFNVYAICKLCISSRKNKRQRKALLKPLQAKVAGFKESLRQLKKQLNVLG
ncbi:hypothetical protein BIY21_08785 [Vibrio ponticus]|uniref:Zinc ribbon domain-containing protein n=1 Tax=Vibrio ponticus TaxID=265668 RepID=A0ABX3FKH8_9VIBR|nr:hypothetical protein [Vibrio ponticus]OLQ94568.1 hypothetical protein BIY21_08785 [Vibrio ponticus]